MSEEVAHKDLQGAVKDINEVFEVTPKIKVITSRPNLEKAIKDTLGGFVSAGDNRIDLLKEETITVYNLLVQPNAVEEVAAEMAEEDAQADELETVAAGEGEDECPVFGQEFDPAAPECVECARAEECAPMTVAKQAKPTKEKATKAAKKPKEPRETKKYTRTQAICEVLQENINSPVTISSLVDGAHAKYMEHGGADDRNVAKRATDILFSGLFLLGHLTKNQDGTVTYAG
jgi:hypothetical protein